ncbi:MAG: hypothetical protein CFE23_01860 [Flavobacterium sp. BFFFF1]|uniref:T9SS type A sorting domain-containing protein n=1 Tax=Flavobacterium sp. BFFFF1 TaxID=2015557 RepID=UPI000BD45841|nr:T9SS type A sorting domain-containing protein [Flavobacterium sp. BFFFF1]OYU82070.1 MAG: hypothetical protein CFE23_01860 [Flavobacterium sp. BFFFF1]
MKKTLLFLIAILAFSLGNAQSISIVGEAVGGWPDNDPNTPDTHIMSTTDNITYTLSNLSVTTAVPGGGLKFRQDGAWAINWGSAAFPSGIGALSGANIVTVAGTYDVTFNRETGAYSFTNVISFPNIGMIGTAVTADGFNGPDVDMVTFDGINYSVTNYNFLGGEMKFRQDDAWEISWGGSTFPAGTATLNSGNIFVPEGTYTVNFNIITGAYSFTFPSVGIIGTAVSANGFNDPDTDLSTTDGIHYVLYNHTFTEGEAKFRQGDAWEVNWGSADFPSGTGTQGGANIMVTAGDYSVHFNRETGEYSFDAPVIFTNIGVLGTAVNSDGFAGPDTNMSTTDGVIYTLSNYVFTDGELKFRQDDAWDINWGVDLFGNTFPAGTAVSGGSNIPVVAGTYTLTFNIQTLAYTFVGTPLYPSIGILGSAVSAEGFSGPDTNLSTTDGETYTLSNYTFTSGEAKFRQDDAWTINWGSPDFPSGTATQGGNNIVVPAGTYNVTFNRSTGAYAFAIVGEFPMVGVLGTAVDGNGFDGPDTDMATTDGILYTLEGFTFTDGEAKFRQDNAWDINWGNAAFPSGTATLGGANIIVDAGTYDVTFNRITGDYNFINLTAFQSIGILGDALTADGFAGPDVDMQTTDGITYTLWAYTFTAGEAKFRQGDAWDVNWGSADFPVGTGTQGGANIPVTPGTYNVTFNILTGAYSFDFVSIGVLGTALNGFDVADTDLSTTDGITYTLENITLTDGLIKFRQNDSWTVNWGGTEFPGGVYTLDGPDIPVAAGTYNISFNRPSGEGMFTEVVLGVNNPSQIKFTVSPNPSSTTWNFSGNTNLTAIEIIDATGKTIVRKNLAANETSIDGSTLSAGLYFAKITADSGSQTIKIIKN